MTQTKTVKDQVLSLLKRRWVTNDELESTVAISAPRRVRELRASGLNVIKRFNEKLGTFEYRIRRG